MALPANPTIGSIHSEGGKRFKYVGGLTPWEKAGDEPVVPTAPQQGQQAVQGGGSGSSYSVGPGGQTSYSVTNQGPTEDLIGSTAYGVGGSTSGGGQITRGSYEGQQQAILDSILSTQQRAEQARIADEAFKNRLGLLTGSGLGTAPATVQHGTSIQGNEAAARAAAFARAKEMAGKNALAGITSLKEIMGGSGLTGSSIEGMGIKDLVAGGVGDINDYTTESLIGDLERAAEIADLEYSGGIQQRGQNLGLTQSLMGILNTTGLY